MTEEIKIICADCGEKNCNKPGGHHLSYWIKFRNPITLLKTTNKEPSIFEAALKDENMLLTLCKELDWQGGTIHQIADEIIKKMK